VDLCTILLEEDVVVDARRYGDILAPLLGVTKVEAKMLLRRGRGILLEDVPEEAARRVAEELARDGIRHWCVKNEQLPPVVAPRRISWAQRAHAALHFNWSGDDLTLDLPWTQVGVLSVGLIALPEWRDTYGGVRFDHLPGFHKLDGDAEARELVRENLILKISAAPGAAPMKRKPGGPTIFERLATDFSTKLKVFVDIVAADRSVWLRATMDEVGYSHDEGGVRFGDAWGVNYLVGDLIDHAPKAATMATLQLLDGADIKDLVFLTHEEFNRYTTWNLWKRELACAASSLPSPEPPAPSTDGGSSNASHGPGTPSISP
jgi:hypothetical protein